MSIQSELSAALKLFSARLDDANDAMQKADESTSPAASVAYVSKQMLLLTDLAAAMCVAIAALADQADEQRGRTS